MANKYRARSARARVWEAIRALKKFTVNDLCRLTGADAQNVKRYVRVLELAGYISKKQSKVEGNRFEYLLVKNSGPKAPVQKLIRCVWDPNTNICWSDKPYGSETADESSMSVH